MTKKIFIDCDPGIDDALAIALAHGSAELDVVGLTTVGGNVDIEHTTRNALALVEFFGMPGVTVARGAGHPLVREPQEKAEDVHGANGLGNVHLPAPATPPAAQHAVDRIIDTLAAAPGEISLVATGPLTNIALALRKQPRITEWAREFVIMGGTFTRGNRTPAAEFNIATDPEAAAVVFDAAWPGKLVMVGLDLTLQARANAPVRARLAGLGRLDAELLTPCLDFYSRHRQYRDKGPAIHDACAIAYALDPDLIDTVPARVDVETQGRFTTGMTVTDFDAPAERHNALVATRLDAATFWDVFVASLGQVAERIPA